MDTGVDFTLFALGHSTTLLLAVLNGWHINAHLLDTIIALSIVYRALDNLGAFKTMAGVQSNKKAAVLIFGFFDCLGLATALPDSRSRRMAWSRTCAHSILASFSRSA